MSPGGLCRMRRQGKGMGASLEDDLTGFDAMAGATTLSVPTAADHAAAFVRSLIFSGELAPGDRLPPSRELAAQLGISPVTLRLALRSLQSLGYVITGRGAQAGSRVSDIETLSGCWAAWASRHADDVDGIFELRATVETRIAWLAAERRTDEDLSAIEAANVMLSETHKGVLRWNAAFHDAVAAAAHSRELAAVMEEARGKLFLPVDLALRQHRLEEISRDHADIAQAIRQKNPAAASAAMGAHVDSVRAMMEAALQR